MPRGVGWRLSGSVLVGCRIQTPSGAAVLGAVQPEGEVVLGASPPARSSRVWTRPATPDAGAAGGRILHSRTLAVPRVLSRARELGSFASDAPDARRPS